MASDNDDDVCDDLKGLTVLYSLLCYAQRELASLRVPCDDAELAVANAQAAIRTHIASTKARVVSADADDDPEILLN